MMQQGTSCYCGVYYIVIVPSIYFSLEQNVRILFYFQFEKPGRRDDFDYPEMAKEAVTKALKDAGLQIYDIKQACIGYVYGMYFLYDNPVLVESELSLVS